MTGRTSPKKNNNNHMPKKENAIFIAAAIILGVVVVSFLWNNGLTDTTNPNGNNPLGPTGQIFHFDNEQQIREAFLEAQTNGNGYAIRDLLGVTESAVPTAAGDSSGSKTTSSDGTGGTTYSETNVQVSGVDEPDIVKTDGKYIYSIYKNFLIITNAFPAEDLAIINKMDLGNVQPTELFIENDRVIVMGYSTEYQEGYYPSPYTNEKIAVSTRPLIYPYWGYSRAVIQVYDSTDKQELTLLKELKFTGNQSDARMVDGIVYSVITTYPDYQILNSESNTDDGSIIPAYEEDGVSKPVAIPTDIGYIRPYFAQSFITIVSLDLDSLSVEKETILGNAETVYGSKDSIYVSHTQWNYRPYPILYDVAVDNTTTSGGTSADSSFDEGVYTIIDKFALNNGKISFAAQGKVSGHILNQFSMDEQDAYFRIATTTDATWDNNGKETIPQSSNVFVLNNKMETIGTLDGLAPNEQIYSARFMGDRLYLVTFRQVDPLFVIDLSTPTNPQVLGKLKIPGYSNYLHPLDETHIIGVGKDAEVGKNDAAYYLGLKLAIFDVSDVANPKQVHSLVIGDRGTDSYALQDHHAFLYDAEKELLVLPVYLYEISESDKKPSYTDWPAYGTPTYQGAFVYHVSLTDGFVEKGRITHIDKDIDLKSGYYYDYQYQITRSLLIEDVLYTISPRRIMANDLSNLKELGTVDVVNIPKDFKITSRVGGGLCAGPCSYQEVTITKDKFSTKSYSGGENGFLNVNEYAPYSQYDDIVELLDWDAFLALDDVIGCPGCADGPTQTVTITKGSITKTVKLDPTEKVEKLEKFFNTLNQYTGGWYYSYADDSAVSSSGASGAGTTATVDPIPV